MDLFATMVILCSVLLMLSHKTDAAGFLHTRGQDMVDERGQQVLLRGVGLGNWLLPEGYMWKFGKEADRPRRIEKLLSELLGPDEAARFWSTFRREYITEADIQRLAELGFNSVRPALNARLFLTEGDPPAFVEEGFGLLDNLISWCRKTGVYVILDLHAAPGGQTGQNIDDSRDDQPALFLDSRNQDLVVDLWTRLASRYKDEPAVAAYDLLNEPLPARTGAAAKYKYALEPLYQRIARAIRKVDQRHMITVEGADWANDWSVFSKPFDDNLFYQFHYYCWDRPTTLKDISKFLAFRDKVNLPVWAGETGERDEGIYWGTTQYFEHHNIGWSFWPWKKMDTRNTPYSITPPAGWKDIAAYSRGEAKPAKEAAQEILNQFLQNIRLENCVYRPEVVNAIFRRVPGRVEAENYGADGLGKSYFLTDRSRNANYYRTTEPVPIVPIEADGGRGGQAIRLGPQEWTAYSLNSLDTRRCEVKVKVKAQSTPAAFQVSLGSFARELDASESGWVEQSVGSISLSKGENRLKLMVTRGEVEFDWMSFQ